MERIESREFELELEEKFLRPESSGGLLAAVKEFSDMSGATSDEMLIRMFVDSRPSENTRSSYWPNIHRFTNHMKGKSLAQITLADLMEYVETVKSEVLSSGEPLSPAGVRSRIDPVKALLSYGHRLGYLPFNVGVVVKLERPECLIESKLLSEDEVLGGLQGLKESNETHWLVVLSIYSVGCRISEFLQLRHRDFVRKGLGYYFVFRASTTKGVRTRRVEVPLAVGEKIANHISRKDRNNPDEPIFSHLVKGRWKGYLRGWVNDFLNQAQEKYGYTKCSPHMFRHSVATHALAGGATMQKVSKMLGHAGMDITLKYYDHTDHTEAFDTGVISGALDELEEENKGE